MSKHVVDIDEALLEHLPQVSFTVTQTIKNKVLHVVLTELGAQRAGVTVENGEVQQIRHELFDSAFGRERKERNDQRLRV